MTLSCPSTSLTRSCGAFSQQSVPVTTSVTDLKMPGLMHAKISQPVVEILQRLLVSSTLGPTPLTLTALVPVILIPLYLPLNCDSPAIDASCPMMPWAVVRLRPLPISPKPKIPNPCLRRAPDDLGLFEQDCSA